MLYSPLRIFPFLVHLHGNRLWLRPHNLIGLVNYNAKTGLVRSILCNYHHLGGNLYAAIRMHQQRKITERLVYNFTFSWRIMAAYNGK